MQICQNLWRQAKWLHEMHPVVAIVVARWHVDYTQKSKIIKISHFNVLAASQENSNENKITKTRAKQANMAGKGGMKCAVF